MSARHISRREFMQTGAAAGVAVAAGAIPSFGQQATSQAAELAAMVKTASYNPAMEYRRLGKTGLWVSAVALGGDWRRIHKIVEMQSNSGCAPVTPEDLPAFEKNRHDVVSRCLEVGINLVDADCAQGIQTYGKALKGRRDKMYLAFSWFEREARDPAYRTATALLKTLEDGIKEGGLDYVDIWRISALPDGGHTAAEVEELIKALDLAKQQGKARFTGFSSHAREWLKMLVETYPQQVEVVLAPYTAGSKERPTDSLFDALKKHDAGFLGIKPFGANSLFKGDSTASSPDADEDDRRARLAIRHILSNSAVTAPIPGLISVHQVDNMARAVKERRELDHHERAELRQAGQEMWARLPADYQWLKDWRYV